jgi:hypothetical protein
LKSKEGFSEEERKTIVKLLAFHNLEKNILKNYKLRKLGRIKRLIKRKWKKLLPLITEDHLLIEKAGEQVEVKKTTDILTLYSKLYSDLVDEYSVDNAFACIQKLKSQNLIPSLNEEVEFEIDRLIMLTPGPKRKMTGPVKTLKVREFPHLNQEVRMRLVKYFKKKLKEEEPLLMLDPGLQLRVENFIRKHVDRIIGVFLEHSYKAMQYGYITKSSEKLSAYVERKGKDSIDWTIKNGVLIDEIVESMS